MEAAPREVFGFETQRAQLGQIFGPQARELIQELRERFALALAFLRMAVERFKRFAITEFQDPFCSRHPIGAFAVNQMPNDIESAPGLFALVPKRPCIREVAEKRIKRCGSPGEK